MDIEYQENKFRASIMLTTPYPGEMELLRTIYLKLMDNDDEKDKILEKMIQWTKWTLNKGEWGVTRLVKCL